MPFVTDHLRLTNSGKLPDVFLTSKIQSPTELNDTHLGRLYFVLQINSPWNHAAPIGTSIINMIAREYFRQEGHIPLENFEYALAKTNRLIEQLIRDGETSCQDLHALVALVVGDEIHVAYSGSAEAYFIRDNKIGPIIHADLEKSENEQAFSNIISGEISADDIVILGSPDLYSAITTEELQLVLAQPLLEAGKAIARRLKQQKKRNANAIILHFDTLQNTENKPLERGHDTLYLDQPIDSVTDIVSYNTSKVAKPIAKGMAWLAKQGQKRMAEVVSKTQDSLQKNKAIEAAKEPVKTNSTNDSAPAKSTDESKQSPITARLHKASQFLTTLKPPLPKLPTIKDTAESAEAGVPVRHYSSRRTPSVSLTKFLHVPLTALQGLGYQFRQAFKRSPRTWYIVISLILLSSLGASIQSHKARGKKNPVVSAAIIDEMKQLAKDADQAKIYGDNDKARTLLANLIQKGQQAKQNSKLAKEAGSIIGEAQRDLEVLAGVSDVTVGSALITLGKDSSHAAIFDGTIYYVTQKGELQSMLLTGGEPKNLAVLPADQAPNQIHLDTAKKVLYIQNYQGTLFRYDLATEKLKEISSIEPPISTGLSTFGDTVYVLDPANNEILKYQDTDGELSESPAYTKNKKVDLSDTIDLSIDGSVFALHKDGKVTKFSRGLVTDFNLTAIPKPYDAIAGPLTFSAIEDGTVYYLTDRGNETIPPRIIEFDKSGKFSHQYFLPVKWQKNIKFIITNPKSHKAWVLVGKDLYEFTLVQ